MRRRKLIAATALLLLLPGRVQASLLSPEAEDALAKYIALFVMFVVPAVLITLFWMVHVLPEKIAHKRHHPQFEAIRTLCLLSLVFGGLLWPIAWIWAYSKPVIYKSAYGTDKAPHEWTSRGAGGTRGRTRPGAPLGLHERLALLEKRGLPPAELTGLRADLDALEAKLAE